MRIDYRQEIPAEAEYFELFESTGWNAEYGLSPRQLREAINGSWALIAAYDGGRLIGSGRIVSDGVFHALVVDLIVLPQYQGQGIGTAIMRRLLDCARAKRIRDVQLFCAKGKAEFYQKLGFRARPADAPGMDLSAL